jgi:hypothetical protein
MRRRYCRLNEMHIAPERLIDGGKSLQGFRDETVNDRVLYNTDDPTSTFELFLLTQD